jgi:hypothetical protein
MPFRLFDGGLVQPLLLQHLRPQSLLHRVVRGVRSRHRSLRVLCCLSVVLVLLYSHTIAFCSRHLDQDAWVNR